MLSGLRSIEWDLQDLEDTVSIVKGNRVKFQLADTDVQARSPGQRQHGTPAPARPPCLASLLAARPPCLASLLALAAWWLRLPWRYGAWRKRL